MYAGAFLFVGLANLLLLCASLAYRRLRAAQKRTHAAQMQSVEMTSIVKAGEEALNPPHNLPKPTRRLVRGFNHAKGPLKRMDFAFKDLSLALPTGQKILSGVTGRLAPGACLLKALRWEVLTNCVRTRDCRQSDSCDGSVWRWQNLVPLCAEFDLVAAADVWYCAPDTLMGKVDKRWKTGGDLRINGVETEMSQFKRVVGYVPQVQFTVAAEKNC